MSATIIIPARMGSSRLPGKMLADINGKPLILRVWETAQKVPECSVLVATDNDSIAAVIEGAGGVVVHTGDSNTGTDRVAQAAEIYGTGNQIIVNLQGDLAIFDPELVTRCVWTLRHSRARLATLATPLCCPYETAAPDVVKVLGTTINASEGALRVLAFSRAPVPHGSGELYKHIGIYAMWRDVLERFAAFPQSPLELRERMEMMRAIENGMQVEAGIIRTSTWSVNTADDLEEVRRVMRAKGAVGC